MAGLGSSCGACKFLRRKCTSECVFAPYFCYDEAAAHFAAVHKVFGASNVSKLLLHLPAHNRSYAAVTISYEALARMRDPIYGCVAHIFALQQQIASLQEEIEFLGNHMANPSVGITNCEGLQMTPYTNYDVQFPPHQDTMNQEYYQNQPAAPLNQTNCTTGQAFDGQANVQFPPYGWEGENAFCDSNPHPVERLPEEVDRDIVAYCSPFNSIINTS